MPVRNADVLVLATLVKDDELVHKLENAVKRDLIVIRLEDDEQAAVLRVLANPPPGLEEVTKKLVAERERRDRERKRLAAAETAA